MYGSVRRQGTASGAFDYGDSSVFIGTRMLNNFFGRSRRLAPGSDRGSDTDSNPLRSEKGRAGSRTIGQLTRFHAARHDREKEKHSQLLRNSSLAIQDLFEDVKPAMKLAVGMIGLPNIIAGVTLLTFQLTCQSFCNRDMRLQTLNYEMGIAETVLGICLSYTCVTFCGILSDELNNSVIEEMWANVGKHSSMVVDLLVDVEIQHDSWLYTIVVVVLVLVAVLYVVAYIIYLRMIHAIGFTFNDTGALNMHCQGLKCIYHQVAFVNTVQLLTLLISTPYLLYRQAHSDSRMDKAARCIQHHWHQLNKRCREIFRAQRKKGTANDKTGAADDKKGAANEKTKLLSGPAEKESTPSNTSATVRQPAGESQSSLQASPRTPETNIKPTPRGLRFADVSDAPPTIAEEAPHADANDSAETDEPSTTPTGEGTVSEAIAFRQPTPIDGSLV